MYFHFLVFAALVTKLLKSKNLPTLGVRMCQHWEYKGCLFSDEYYYFWYNVKPWGLKRYMLICFDCSSFKAWNLHFCNFIDKFQIHLCRDCCLTVKLEQLCLLFFCYFSKICQKVPTKKLHMLKSYKTNFWQNYCNCTTVNFHF